MPGYARCPGCTCGHPVVEQAPLPRQTRWRDSDQSVTPSRRSPSNREALSWTEPATPSAGLNVASTARSLDPALLLHLKAMTMRERAQIAGSSRAIRVSVAELLLHDSTPCWIGSWAGAAGRQYRTRASNANEPRSLRWSARSRDRRTHVTHRSRQSMASAPAGS